MSKLLAYESYLVDLGRSITSAREEFRTHFENNSWQIVEDDAINEYLYVAPPATEAVGNANGRQVLRLDFTSTEIGLQGFLQTNKSNNKKYSLYLSFSTSTETYSFNINGFAYSTGSVNGSSSDARISEIYDALVLAKADPANSAELGNLNFELVQREENYHYIIVTSSNNEDFSASSGSRVTLKEISRHLSSGDLIPEARTRRKAVSCDYASGFIYYLSIHERSVVLATKTTINFYGPVFGSWAENDVIAAQTSPEFHLMELYVGDIPSSTWGEVNLSTTHITSFIDNGSTNEGNRGSSYDYDATWDSTSERGVDIMTLNSIYKDTPIRMYDAFRSDRNGYLDLKGSCFPAYHLTTYASYFVGKFDLGHTKVLGQDFVTGRSTSLRTHLGVYPNFDLKDVYTFNNTATDESLHLMRLADLSSELSSPISDTDVSLTLSDASAFPETGTLIINDEVIRYSSKSVNTLTGLTRGSYGTLASAHGIGDEVMSASWFVKINNGALLAGSTRPA